MLQHPYAMALLAILAFAIAGWLLSVLRGNVSFVDSLWSLFFLVAAAFYVFDVPTLSTRGQLVLVLVAIWALRLAIHITVRNWGEPEDARYQSIRANNQPYFGLKSLYIVFGLQGVLAWLVSMPLLPAISSAGGLNGLDLVAVALWTTGFIFEAGGDYQLATFKAREREKDSVLNTGLWRYTRHPNYFGEFCMWWSFYLLALPGGGWWTIFSPLLMSFLLLKVSGVAMLERTITDRRPAYAVYMRRTNAFFPGPRRMHSEASEAGS
jgi:steroid 5-alpha reductase family enzyme